VVPARTYETKAKINVTQGVMYFLHRNKPGEVDIDTPCANATVEGTEFNLTVETNGTTRLTLIDGTVALSNQFGQVRMASGEIGLVEPGQAPQKPVVQDLLNIIQWCLYYPGVLDPAELGLGAEARAALGKSLESYRQGNLLAALNSWPAQYQPATVEERLFLAGLRLSAGATTNYQELIQSADQAHPLAIALRYMVAAAKNESLPGLNLATNASQLVGRSYYLQSRYDLAGALLDVRQAVEVSPNFGFAWERVAELEFSHGRIRAAEAALEKALACSPQNAQAHALRGFSWLAKGKPASATAAFEEAMRWDSALGSAWLGRGLCRISQGQTDAGRADMQAAAVLEPNRWIYRCYLAKAYSLAADATWDHRLRREYLNKAEAELALAKKKAPKDPTPWLYSALLTHQQYRTTEAIRDLERSIELNDNRQVFRSRLMLDQDQAVRSANLAQIYESAGMSQVSVRESAKAGMFDYGNYSAHLNLAGSYYHLRDPTRFSLRHESEWFNEHLLASLLAPSGAGALSQNMSQEEYSRVFSKKKFGLNSSTEYLSTGEWRELATHYGQFGGFSYAFDLDYQHKAGIRPNNDLSRLEWYSRLKQQITAQDSVMLITKYQDYDSGDQFQYYDPAGARPNYRSHNEILPWVLAGLHHEWSPGVHTLALGGRLINDQRQSDVAARQTVGYAFPANDPEYLPADVNLQTKFEIYSGELNQIFQREKHTDILGVRFQSGDFTARSTLDNFPPADAGYFVPPVNTTGGGDFERLSLYAYHHWKVRDDLLLLGGVAYDHMTYPLNYRRPPLQAGQREKDLISPKAALIWNPRAEVTLRGAYARALGGVSYDESIRLEPTQLAGFSQSYRTLISESLIGSVEAPVYDIAGGALDLKFKTGTYLSLDGQWKRSRVDRGYGYFALNQFRPPPDPIGLPALGSERWDFREISGGFILNQRLADCLFGEVGYRFTHATLERGLPDIPATPAYQRTTQSRADLHELQGAVMFTHPTGFFFRPEAHCYFQDNRAGPGIGDETHSQIDLYAGYRFPRHKGELTVGLLNAADRDYRLSPLNYYLEMPRERTLYLRLKLNF
jgi:Tfp pilus assembly protein PilF